MTSDLSGQLDTLREKEPLIEKLPPLDWLVPCLCVCGEGIGDVDFLDPIDVKRPRSLWVVQPLG